MRQFALVWVAAFIALAALVGDLQLTVAQPPAASPAAWFEWASDFENGFAGWDPRRIDRKGAGIDVVPDPTSSNKGKVMKAWIEGPPPAVEPGDPRYSKRRAYPAIWFPLKPLPCSMQEDVWVSRELAEQATRRGNWYSQLSFFDSTAYESDKWHVAVTTNLRQDSHFGLDIKGEGGAGISFPVPLPGAPRFVPENWVTLKVVIEADGKVSLYQNGVLITAGQLPPTTRRGFVGGHGGLYVGHDISVPEGDFTSGYIYADNFRIACWR